MVNPPEINQKIHADQSPKREWPELSELIDGISDSNYIKALQESRNLDEEFIKEFRTVLSSASADDPKTQKRQEAQAIRDFFTDKLGAGQGLSTQQMATILYELKDRGDDNGVVDVFEAGIPSGLGESAVLKEFYAVSLNKVGRLEDSIDALKELRTDGNARVGEIAGILGKVHKLQSKEATDEQEKIEYMRQSVDSLQDGFYETYEFYPGINLVYNQIDLAKMTGDVSLLEKAFNDAELVMYSAKKAGAERTSDFWTAATLLESSIFTGAVTPQMIQRCLETSQHDWELGATISNLKAVTETITAQLATDELDQATSERLRKILDTINGNTDTPGVLSVLQGENPLSLESIYEPNDSILEQGFMYGETTTLIGGNVQFGGQLQAHTVNRFDVKVAYGVMEHFGLDTIGTIDDFNRVADGIIRKQFGTAALEDLHGDAHKVYDAQIQSLLDVLGINGQVDKSVVDSRTNVMVDFLLGKGDCRQHAQAKQLLFDSWKTFQLKNLIGMLKESHATPDSIDGKKIRQQINELLSRQMMVFDSIVEAKIQMTGLYDPKQNSDGSLIESDSFEPVEDHTWNGILSFDEFGHVSSIEMADSFYQQEYGFGGRSQVIENPGTYTQDGMVVTQITATDKDGIIKKIPVRLKPTPYAGSRGKRMLTHADVGAAHLRGVSLGYDIPEIADVFSSLKITELWQQMAIKNNPETSLAA